MKIVSFSTNTLTDDKFFIVDDEDFDRVSAFKWHVLKKDKKRATLPPYIRRSATKEEILLGAPRKIYLHRYILEIHLKNGSNDRMEVDHINRNTLDNRKSNLRIVDKSINQRNKKNNTNIGQKLWGTTYNKKIKNENRKWQANFHIKGKNIYVWNFFH